MALALFLAVVGGMAAPYLAVAGPEDQGGAMNMADPTLKQELRVRDARQGIAGTTGVEWVIEASGNWRVARFINEDVQPPERQGQLSAEEMDAIAETLRAHNFERVATETGKEVDAARAVTVTYGDKSVSVPLDPTAGRLSGLVEETQQQAEGPTSDVLAVVGTVIDVTEKN